MATQFSEIYCLNEVIKNDPKMDRLPSYLYNSICFKYLKLGLGFCTSIVSSETSNYILKLIDITEPIETEYEFIGNGIDSQFLLSPPPTVDSKFYVGVKKVSEDIYTETTDFTFDSLTNVLEINTVPQLNSSVKVVTFTIGQFNQTLDYTLQLISTEAMTIPFLEENQNNRNLLSLIVHSNAWRLFSQNDHLRGINFVVKSQREYVSRLLVDYSYSNTGEKMVGLIGKKA